MQLSVHVRKQLTGHAAYDRQHINEGVMYSDVRVRQVCADGLIRLQLRRAFQFGLHLDWKLCYMTAVWRRSCEVY